MPTTPNVRVIVRLPYNRPEQPMDGPPRVGFLTILYQLIPIIHQVQIEWNSEKANILWEVIARSRASDSGGTDCELFRKSPKHA